MKVNRYIKLLEIFPFYTNSNLQDGALRLLNDHIKANP